MASFLIAASSKAATCLGLPGTSIWTSMRKAAEQLGRLCSATGSSAAL